MRKRLFNTTQTVVRHRRKHRAIDPIRHQDVGEHIVTEHLIDERHVLVLAEGHLEDIVEQGDDGAGAEREIDGAEVGEGERMQEGGVDGGGDIDEDRDGVGEGDVEEAALEEQGRVGRLEGYNSNQGEDSSNCSTFLGCLLRLFTRARDVRIIGTKN